MKTKLLLITLFTVLISQAQITKTETFLTGTKVTFYTNQCGNTIPEAQGKLSFCDRANNLGVVERSYGLNDNRVNKMLPNYYNQDEVYVTSTGLSIKNADDTWENIPNMAIPLWGSTYIPTIQNGLILPNNKIIILATNSGIGFNVYDRDLKTFTTVNFPNNKYPQQVLYDTDRNLTWTFAKQGNTTYLFTYDGTSLTEIANLGSISVANNSTTIVYKNNHIYLGNNDGLYKMDVSDYTNTVPVTHYDSTTTPNLPYDRVNDLQFDTNGDLWLTNNETNVGVGIVKFNITNETYDLYQLETPNNSTININFKKLALDQNNVIWAVGNNYAGLVKLTFTGTTPNWELLPLTDLTTLGVPITYIPNHVYFRNNKFYFTTSDGSSGTNNNFEVIINDNNVWSGRNDNEAGNLSRRMNNRFTDNLPDDNGGVWWFNRYDDIVVYRDKNDEHHSILLNIGFNNQAIDVDNKAIIKGGNPNEIRKIDFPNAISIQSATNQATAMQQVGDKTWIYDKSVPKIDIYQNGVLVNTHTLDETDYQYCYNMAVDDNDNPWFMRYVSGNQLQIKKFDTNTATTVTYNRPEFLGVFKKIIAAPNNAIWIVGASGVMYIENGNFHTFLVTDHIELSNITDAIVDTNGKFHFVSTNTNSGAIGSIENPTSATPIFTKQYITGNYNSPLLSSFNSSSLSNISIDSEGSICSFAGNAKGAIKLIDNDLSVEYRRQAYTVNVNQNEKTLNVTIYPNPTSSLLTVKTDKVINKIEVYSILGRKIYQKTNSNVVNIAHLNAGIYLIKIYSKKNVITKQIIKY